MAVGELISSPAWGSVPYEITQEFGVLGADPSLYPGPEYTEPLGWPAGYHIGLDVGVPKNTPIYALNPGKVIQAGFSQYFRPKPVWVETTDNPNTQTDESGYIEIYGHLWEDAVSKGDEVNPTQQLGWSGEETIPMFGSLEPDRTGAHLHFELRRPSGGGQYTAVDPHAWLTQSGSEPTAKPTPNPRPVPDDTNGQTPTIPVGLFSDIAKNLSQRTILIIIGIVVLAVGAFVVLKS